MPHEAKAEAEAEKKSMTLGCRGDQKWLDGKRWEARGRVSRFKLRYPSGIDSPLK